MRLRPAALLLAAPLLACGAPRPRAARGADVAATESGVSAFAEGILAAARARDAERFAAHFAPDSQSLYVLNTRPPIGQAALRDAFVQLLARQATFDPRWIDRRVQVIAPGVAVFTGRFRTAARDTSGRAWGAEGIVTFVARRHGSEWRVLNWHASEAPAP